jgi:hypothetical protein
MPMLRALATVALAGAVAAATGCGGDSAPGASSTPTADVGLAKMRQITSADVAVFSAANATSNLVSNPGSVKRARALLRPLIVANTLKVGASNAVAGGLVSQLTGQLDNAAPGLTKQTAKGEVLDRAAVHRLLRYGSSDPTKVFEPKAASGVRRLERLLGGLTARSLVERDAAQVQPYWPDLARRLKRLDASLP